MSTDSNINNISKKLNYNKNVSLFLQTANIEGDFFNLNLFNFKTGPNHW